MAVRVPGAAAPFVFFRLGSNATVVWRATPALWYISSAFPLSKVSECPSNAAYFSSFVRFINGTYYGQRSGMVIKAPVSRENIRVRPGGFASFPRASVEFARLDSTVWYTCREHNPSGNTICSRKFSRRDSHVMGRGYVEKPRDDRKPRRNPERRAGAGRGSAVAGAGEYGKIRSGYFGTR